MLVDGIDLEGRRRRGRARPIGFLGHRSFLYDHLTARENLELYARLYGVPGDTGTLAEHWLEKIGLARAAHRPVRGFSRGMMQRLALARALQHAPRLVLLDEPTTGLDPEGRARLDALLASSARAASTLAMISHRAEAALPLADRVLVLNRGRIAALGAAATTMRPAGPRWSRRRGRPRERPRQLSRERHRRSRVSGVARASAALFVADLRRELRTGEALVPMLMFAMIVLVVAGVTFNLPELGPDDRRRLAPGILWTAIAFAMLVGQARALLVDRDEERWQGLLLSPLDRTALFAVKWFEGLLLGLAVEALLVPLTIVFFDLPPGIRWEQLALALLAGTGGLAALGTLLGSLTTSLGRGEAMLSILVLPVASPILIAGSMTTATLLAGGTLAGAAPWPAVLVATLGLNLALGAILFESVLVE